MKRSVSFAILVLMTIWVLESGRAGAMGQDSAATSSTGGEQSAGQTMTPEQGHEEFLWRKHLEAPLYADSQPGTTGAVLAGMSIEKRLLRQLLRGREVDGPDFWLREQRPEEASRVIRSVVEDRYVYAEDTLVEAANMASEIAMQLSPAQRRELADVMKRLSVTHNAQLRNAATAAVHWLSDDGVAEAVFHLLNFGNSWFQRRRGMAAAGRSFTPDQLDLLRDWHRRVTEADRNRAPNEKWLWPGMERTYQDAIRQIESRAAAATRPATQPTTRPAAPNT